jgi:hypothetical protein
VDTASVPVGVDIAVAVAADCGTDETALDNAPPTFARK